MPKMKTHRGASKRFKISKNGKVKHRRGFRAHILTKKSQKRKRHLRKPGFLSEPDAVTVKKLLPYD